LIFLKKLLSFNTDQGQESPVTENVIVG